MKKPAWSHSSLKDFEGCARRYHEVKVLKNYPFQDTEQTRYGKQLHKAAEDYIKDDTPLPEQFAFVQPTLDSLKAKTGRKFVEYEMGLTEDLNPCAFDSENVWVRGIADLLVVNGDKAFIVDYKTGSNKYPDLKQLQLMALMTFAHFPEVQTIHAGLLFVMHKHFITDSYTRDRLDDYWKDFWWNLERLHNSHVTDTWQPNPTPLCGWCPVKTCEYHKEK